MFVAVGIFAAEIEQVYTRENDEKATKEGNCVYGRGGIEALEEETGCNEGACRKGDIVEGVDTGKG